MESGEISNSKKRISDQRYAVKDLIRDISHDEGFYPGCCYCGSKDTTINDVSLLKSAVKVSVLCKSCKEEDWVYILNEQLAKIACYF